MLLVQRIPHHKMTTIARLMRAYCGTR